MNRLLLLATLPAIVVFVGTAEASFTQELGSPVAVGTAPYDVVSADFDRDGRPDLATANGTASTISVLLRQPSGGFAAEGAAIPAGTGTSALAVADFNSDARLDLVSANYQSFPNGTGTAFLRNPISGFAQESGTYPIPGAQSVVAADFTGDTQPDIAWGSFATDAIYVFARNVGAGFTQEGGQITTPGHKVGLAAADFNGDGRVDLASANDSAGTVSVLLRQVSGFAGATDIPVGPNPRRLTTADFNGDGRVDIAVTLLGADAVAVLLGQGGGLFAAAPGSPYGVGDAPIGIAAADFNRDGATDLAVASNGGHSVNVLLRSGAGFAPDPSSPIPTGQLGASGIAAADYTGDGRTDVAVSNSQSNSVTVLANTTPDPPKVGIPIKAPKKPVLRRKTSFAARTSPKGFTKFTALKVAPVKRGDRIAIVCKGTGCKLSKKTIKVKKNKKSLSVLKHLKGSKLRKGATLQLRVTRKGAIGRVTTWKIRAPKKPQVARACLAPGKTKPSACP